MKTPALLIEPDVAGHHAKDQAASLLRIAIIRRGIDIKPDMFHVSEIAAQLFNHLVALAFGAETRSLHDFEFFKLRAMFQNHVEIGVESAGSDNDASAVNLQRVTVAGGGDAAYPAALRQEFPCFGRGHDRDVGQRLGGFDQRGHQA